MNLSKNLSLILLLSSLINLSNNNLKACESGDSASCSLANTVATDVELAAGQNFEREKMCKIEDSECVEFGTRVEGYWATCEDLEKDNYKGAYPFPKAHAEPWPGQAEFLEKLNQIEAVIEVMSGRGQCMDASVHVNYFRGFAKSRLQKDFLVGCEEYYCNGITWPKGFSSHYVKCFNVQPSREFYDFVMQCKVIMPLIFLNITKLEIPVGATLQEFEREQMYKFEEGGRVEGYWAYCEDPEKDGYKGAYPFPKAHAEPWPGQAEFLEKLNQIEAVIEVICMSGQYNALMHMRYFRGFAKSRLEKDVFVGANEYICNGILWPEGFSSYYVKRFNVQPSREFYDFVMQCKVIMPNISL